MDVMIMTLTLLNHGGPKDILGKVFGMKCHTFERLVVGFMKVAAPVIEEKFIDDVAYIHTMTNLKEHRKTFKYCPFAVEAIDVTLQQSNRPSGNMQEGKRCFSGKHKLYEYKIEVCVRSNGMECAYSKYYPGSVSDIAIMTERVDEHNFRIEKAEEDKTLRDDYYMHEKFLNHWCIIADKSYQVAHEMIRCLNPYKKPTNGALTAEKERFNKKHSSDRMIVENFFGRMMMLWNIMAEKHKWSEKLYDYIATMCISLTKFHIDRHPLRRDDGEWYGRYMNRITCIGEEKQRNLAETQAMYRRKRKQRLSIRFRSVAGENDETQSE